MIKEKQTPLASEKPEKDTSRLEAFSDGVFAIAITLHVLNLKVPDIKPIDSGALATALGEDWATYLVFVISFATILIMWVYHHNLFQSMQRAETVMLVTVVPFPTALVGTYLKTPAASVAFDYEPIKRF